MDTQTNKLKDTYFILLFLFSFSCYTYAQNKTYELLANNTEEVMLQKQQLPYVYTVVLNKNTTQKETKVKVLNKAYTLLQTEINIAKKDSTVIASKENKEIAIYENINTITASIDDFLNSRKPFDMKKSKLIVAQKTANENNLDLLIYADQTINSKKKSKFFALKLNEIDLKVHLKKITWKLTSINKKPQITSKVVNTKLHQLREQIKDTEKFEFIEGPLKTIHKSAYAIQEKINDPSNLNGVFIVVNDYYVIGDHHTVYNKNELVSRKIAEKRKINPKYFAEKDSKLLIQNTKDKSLYLVNSDFLNLYAIDPNKPIKKPKSGRRIISDVLTLY